MPITESVINKQLLDGVRQVLLGSNYMRDLHQRVVHCARAE